MKIAFLIHNVYGIGGTIRSTVNLSRALAARHDVEIVSVHRVANSPALPIDPRVKVRSLIDMREDAKTYEGGHELTRKPTELFHDSGVAGGRLAYTGLHDERIAKYLRTTKADVVIGTRPILNGYLARFGSDRYLRIGQEHLTHDSHEERTRTGQNAALAQLDAFVTVSEGDAEVYRRALPAVAGKVLCIPNGVPAPEVEPSDLETKLVVAAGRLVAVKRYDRLVRAFAKVSERHPDWTLRIYGRGAQRAALRQLVDELGVYNNVFLMGARSPIDTEWAKGAIAAVTSNAESFGMTIVEAMHCGLPVVATDCPFGPAEIIDDGVDGLLVPLDGVREEQVVDAYANALLELIEDPARRHRMGQAARLKARAFRPSAIARRYEALIRDLLAARYLTRLRGGPEPAPSLKQRARATARSAVTALRRPAPPVAPARPSRQKDGQSLPRPMAHCSADGKGDVSVRVAAADLPGGDLNLLLRLRGAEPPVEVRVPLPPRTELRGTRVEAVLDHSVHDLAEGRWDTYVEHPAEGRRRRIGAELVEQRRLLDVVPDAVGGVRHWIPYTTTDGFLAVRAWRRAAHAEVASVTVDGEGFDVTATAHGVALPAAGSLVEVRRRGGDEVFEVAARAAASADRFSFRVPHTSLATRRAAEHDVWDLWLLPAPGADPVRLGRIFGDGADRKKTDVFPAALVEQDRDAPMRIKPYFTVDNELSVSVKDGEAEEEPPAAAAAAAAAAAPAEDASEETEAPSA
ncbi:glycosyltransferase family 4 protein [Streptomyces capparidis]